MGRLLTAASTRVHPPGKRSAHDTPWDAVRARLGRFYGEVTTTRRIIFQMAEVAVPRMLFEAILKRIGELAPAAA